MKQEQDSLSTGTTEAASTDKEVQPVKPVKPVKPPRPRLRNNLYEPYVTPPIVYHAVRWFAIFALHITARIRLRGLYNVPKKGAFIIASNHLSWTDIVLIPFHLSRKVVYMAKEEYYSSRLAWLVRFMGAFPVKRGEGDRQALRAGEEQLKKGNILAIFPEGTRSHAYHGQSSCRHGDDRLAYRCACRPGGGLGQ